eukprot:5865131-Amphidinium_carterae.5
MLDLHLLSRANVKEQPGGWNPTKGDVGKDRPSLKAVKKAKREEEEIVASAVADSDWRTCRESRRSYSGGVSLLQQRLSLRAVTTGLSEAQGSIPLHVHTDSEVARCIPLRAGVIPKDKRLGIRALHCQQVCKEGRAHLHKVAGTHRSWVSNPENYFTKPVTAEVMHRLLPLLKLQSRTRMFKDLKLRGRALAGVVIASLTTSAVAEAGSTLVEPTVESCVLPSTQVEYCSQEAVLQRALEIVQMRLIRCGSLDFP